MASVITTVLSLVLCFCLCQHCSAFLHNSDSNCKRPGSQKAYKPEDDKCNPPLSLSFSIDDMIKYLQSVMPKFDGVVKEALSNDSSPGGAVISFVYKDEVIWTGGYGLKDMKNPSLGVPDKDTRFRIGSITKLFTALQTLMMRDSGHVKSLDDDINIYYPEFKVQNPFQTERGITFRQLMSHMSGLGRNAPCKGIFDTGCNISDAEMLKNIAEMRLMYPPGTQPAYSNLGFGLLGQVLTRIAKAKSWDDLLNKMILQPLGMSNTGNSFDKYDPKKMAMGYYPDGSEADLIDIGWDAPAGQSYSSTADLAKLMSLVFSTDKSSKEQLVDGETLREWIQPAYKYIDQTGFSYPWEIEYVGSYKLHTKDGVMNGYNAEFQMELEGKIGFILLQSCDGCTSHRVIIYEAQKMLEIMMATLMGNNVFAAPPIPPHPQDYVGIYIATVGRNEIIANVSLQVKQNHPALYTTEGNDTALLKWHDEDAFQITESLFYSVSFPCAVLSSGQIGAWVYFQRDSTGKIVSLTVPSIGYGVVYMKQK